MIIYNVTTKVHWSIHDQWVQWMKEKHIPDVKNTGHFTNAQMVRLLETDDTEGPTYAVQYTAATMDDYRNYLELHAARLREDAFGKWGNLFISFRSLMELVH